MSAQNGGRLPVLRSNAPEMIARDAARPDLRPARRRPKVAA